MTVSMASPTSSLRPGVNLPQATFGSGKFPGVPNKDYAWPTPAEVDAYAVLGFNNMRIGFFWERMQPKLHQPLDATELAQLDALVAAAATKNVVIIVDVHNFGKYRDQPIGSHAIPAQAFADLWTRLAAHFKDRPNVSFGLMNEPYQQNAAEWAGIAQLAVSAIRATGARQPILVGGTHYSNAHTWTQKDGELSNAEALGRLADPTHNLIFEVHDYFDADASGTHPTCVSAEIGRERLTAFTAWLQKTNHRGYLGEFGASKDPVCLQAMKNTLALITNKGDLWYGWSYWAAAAWFGDYMFNIYPPDPERFPQIPILKSAFPPNANKPSH